MYQKNPNLLRLRALIIALCAAVLVFLSSFADPVFAQEIVNNDAQSTAADHLQSDAGENRKDENQSGAFVDDGGLEEAGDEGYPLKDQASGQMDLADSPESAPDHNAKSEPSDGEPSAPVAFRSAMGVRANGGALRCEEGYIYGMSNKGQLRVITPNMGIRKIGSKIPDGGTGYNALGVAKHGEFAYVVKRGAPGNKTQAQVFRFDPKSGKWEKKGRAYTPRGFSSAYVAGAVHLKSGDYYFGGFKTRINHEGRNVSEFRLWRYSLSRGVVEYVGHFDIGVDAEDAWNNGDMAFDAEGNLYVIRSGKRRAPGEVITDTGIYVVLNNVLSRSPMSGVSDREGYYEDPPLPIRAIESARVGSYNGKKVENINGIAFSSDGRIYLSGTKFAGVYDTGDYHANPKFIDDLLNGDSEDVSVDLGSCSPPPILRLKKNVINRYDANDRFELELWKVKGQIGTRLQAVVTEVAGGNGVQAEAIGPVPVVTGEVYHLKELLHAPRHGHSLADYQRRSWQCVVDYPDGRVMRMSGIFTRPDEIGSITIPEDAKSAVIECQIENIAKPTKLTWRKVDKSGKLGRLSGSEWSLKAPNAADVISIKDCALQGRCAGTNDEDPKPGVFQISVWDAGKYDLTELKAPVGFLRDSKVHAVNVHNVGDAYDFGDISNERLEARLSIMKRTLGVNGDEVEGRKNWTFSTSLKSPPIEGVSIEPNRQQVTDLQGTLASPWVIYFNNEKDRQALSVTETPQDGWVMDSVECRNREGLDISSRLQINTIRGEITVANVAPQETIDCMVVNRRLPGQISWRKVDAHGSDLAGSEWTLQGPGMAPDGKVITDCVLPGHCERTFDIDPLPGHLRVDNLSWGEYVLREKQAPPGYKRDEELALSFEIDATHRDVSLGNIVNRPVTLPSLPFTGGMSSDAFVVSGLGALGLSVFGALWRGRRRKAGVRA